MNRKKREANTVFRILNERKNFYRGLGINIDLPTATFLRAPRRRRRK